MWYYNDDNPRQSEHPTDITSWPPYKIVRSGNTQPVGIPYPGIQQSGYYPNTTPDGLATSEDMAKQIAEAKKMAEKAAQIIQEWDKEPAEVEETNSEEKVEKPKRVGRLQKLRRR